MVLFKPVKIVTPEKTFIPFLDAVTVTVHGRKFQAFVEIPPTTAIRHLVVEDSLFPPLVNFKDCAWLLDPSKTMLDVVCQQELEEDARQENVLSPPSRNFNIFFNVPQILKTV